MNGSSGRFTLDTNLLVYAIDSASGLKHEVAGEIVLRAARLDCLLTLQATSEFYAAVTRKGMMAPTDAAAQADDWLSAFRCVTASISAVRIALGEAASGRASYWDALLVATAAEAGCAVILTEDLADGTSLVGVEIHNPFAAAGGLTERTLRLLDP